MQTLTEWDIESSKILMAVTDNGSNMIKAIASVKLVGGARESETESESDSDINVPDDNVALGDHDGPDLEQVREDEQHSDEDDDDMIHESVTWMLTIKCHIP